MRELFASDNFDVIQFIASNKDSNVDNLLKDLENISNSVQNELFDLINGDLAHFQTVIKEVCEVDIATIKQSRASLEEDKNIKEESYLRYKEYFEEVEKKYERLKYIQKKKDLLIRTGKARKYIETFKARQNIAEHSIYELEISVKKYSWLLNFVTEFSDELIESESDFNAELSEFSERIQETIEIHVRRAMSGPIDPMTIQLLLKLCQEMNKMNLFEASFKMTIIYPTLESILQSSISFKGSSLNFKQFIDQTTIFILNLKSTWSEFLSIFGADESKFWSRTLLSPLLAWIVERCSSVFNPIDLDEFKNNFEAGLKFVSNIEEEFFDFEDELLFFRSQSSWINFMKKWSLHQYFQSRTKQIISPIENIMSCDLELENEIKLFDQTLVTINALKHLWSDEVILKPLIPKFLKITIQTFRRFILFCTEDVSSHQNPKLFIVNSLHKQFNLERFVELLEKNLNLQFKKHLDSLDEGLSENILINFKGEVEESLKRSRDNLVPGIEKIYDQQLLNKEDLNLFNLEALKILKDSKVEVNYDMKQLIQQILLKFNRIVFKLIDEKRMKVKNSDLIDKMKIVEEEAAGLGYNELVNEEFWLEIKAAIN